MRQKIEDFDRQLYYNHQYQLNKAHRQASYREPKATKRMAVILLIIGCVLLALFAVTVARGASEEEMTAGTWMIQKGAEGFVYSIGDMIYGIGGEKTTNRSTTDNLIISLLTYNVDPYSFQEVRDWQDYCAAAFIVLGIGALLIAFIFLQLDLQSIDDLIGEGYTQNRIIDTLLTLLVVPLISVFGVWAVLKLNYIISLMIVDYMLMTIPQTSDNFLIYVFMALAFVFLSIVLFVRAIYIVVFATISIAVAVSYGVAKLRQMVIDYVYAFLKIVFLQPKLLLIMVLGIVIISHLPLVIMQLKAFAYLSLVLYLCWVGYNSISGNAITTVVKVAIFRKAIR